MWFVYALVIYFAGGAVSYQLVKWNNEPAVTNIQTGTTIPASDKRDIKRIINGTYKFRESYTIIKR